MDDEITEFEEFDPTQLHLVGAAANGFPPLLAKGLAEEVDDAAAEKAFLAQYPEPLDEYAVKFVSAAQRRKFARSGVAMPNGDFPIPDEGHLKSAIGRLGNYHGDTAKAKRHIIKRARALGLTHLLPEDWHVSKAMDTQAEDEDVEFPSPESTQGQTHEMHPGAGAQHPGNVSQDGGDPPSGRYSKPPRDLPNGEGFGDTAPSKAVPMNQALGQTRGLARKGSEGENQDVAAAGGPSADMTGDAAPNGEAEAHAAEDEAQGQTREMERKAGSGGSDQMRRQDEQSQKAKRRVEGDNPEDTQPHSDQWEGKDAALAEGAHQLLEQAMALVQEFEAREKAEIGSSKKAMRTRYPDIRRTAQLLAGLANGKATSTGPVTKEIEDMTQDELIKLLDARDAQKAKEARRQAKKAQREDGEWVQRRQAEKAAKAAKKAAKQAGRAVDTTGLTKGIAEALAAAVKPLETRLKNVEDQPARPVPMLNAAGLPASTGPRGGIDASAFKALEDAVEAAPNERARQRAQGELMKARMIAAERMRQANPGEKGPVALIAPHPVGR